MHFETQPSSHYAAENEEAVGIIPVSSEDMEGGGASLEPSVVSWAKAAGFTARKGEHLLVPGESGALRTVLMGVAAKEDERDPMAIGTLARKLPEGTYRLGGDMAGTMTAELAWAFGGYSFDRYRKRPHATPRLAVAENADRERIVGGTFVARDLINIPANDMGPEALEAAFRKLAKEHGADVSVISGDDLLTENFPMVHAVGRASVQAPRVLDLTWGKEANPKITLVGKGVTFDTGGLNIKPGSSMALMKKDMGGAANVMGLAHMIMSAQLCVRLRVIVGAVENAISGNAFRPGDILQSRKGLTVEIGNTDAEGRLVLGDCLALGDEEAPELMIDMATLTGAARVALGPDLPPFYTHDDEFAQALSRHAEAVCDPIWRMPLWAPYQEMLSSKVADVNHITSGGFAGSITAALFLSRFVEAANNWAHFDIFGWVPNEKPAAPVGGEAQAIRALYDYLGARYGG